ncbi:hypothetical protein J6590_005119 [Homalodisca vitripennis]|nr:hypothetical protein J6590_005119 [Homalodisca vitripennis]
MFHNAINKNAESSCLDSHIIVDYIYWWREKRRDLARAGAQLCTSVLPRGNFRCFAPQPTLRIVYPSNGVICFQ